MLAIPAIDLRDGHCVQLVGGDYEHEALRLDEHPLDVARRWAAAGFSRLHIVDLDAATGRGRNDDIIRELIRSQPLPLQVGGGVRDEGALDAWLDEGADAVVLGTRGLEDPAWLAERAALAPGRIILAADVRGRQLVTQGWRSGIGRTILELLPELDGIPLAGLLVTAVHREGRLEGVDLPLLEDVVDACACPVIAAGGIASMTDLRDLEDLGVAAAVLGMSLYADTLDPRVVAEEFAA